MNHRVKPLALVIEDDPDNRALFAQAAQLAGYEVVQAVDGLIGLATLDAMPIQTLILDLKLSEAPDGLDILRRVQADPRYDGLHLLIITGDSDAAPCERAEALFHKPPDLRQVIATLKRLCDAPRSVPNRALTLRPMMALTVYA